ncbi:hypothetical protein OO014_06020 [Intrasporangium calvum]|uniref:Uncharacterized protein n=1 Tax=Intrasporangium calvum TaxID=53358 RepID=A0ABT5GEX8_9MICO|nr:hypothetical protein [Intrasporangium calvum]MDC5696808.1 hypothetical protein [Intrasporangium calvum]
MRWEQLFDDLEAAWTAESGAQHEAEVADRTRRERAQVSLHARLLANVGRATISVRLAGGTPGASLMGTVTDVGPDWLLLAEAQRGSVLAPLGAVRDLVGLAPGAQEPTLVAKRFTFGAALRGLSRGRVPVELMDLDGRVLTGTIDAVGSDHLDLAEHALDEPRRSKHVLRRHVLPLAALSCLRHH